MKKRARLFVCICCSLSLHALALFLLQYRYLWLASPVQSNPPLTIQVLEKSMVLKESFKTLSRHTPLPSTWPVNCPAQEQLTQSVCQEIQITQAELTFYLPTPPYPAELLASAEAPRLQPPPLEPLELFPSRSSALPTFPAPTLTVSQPSLPLIHPQSSQSLDPTTPPRPDLRQPLEVSYDHAPIDFSFWADEGVVQRASLSLAPPSLPAFPTLEDLETSSLSDSFEIEVICVPRLDPPGYIFALTLIPHAALQLPILTQNYTFLLDRSNSIQRERLIVSKMAILRALEECEPGQLFNIFAFDSRVEKLFPAAKPLSATTRAQAKTFLDKIQLGSFFASADLYAPLLMTLPHDAQDMLHTAILITDGETLVRKPATRNLLYTWTGQNNGKVSLFTVGLSTDSQLATLDVASMFNKGKLFYAASRRGLKRKMMRLMKTIRSPIAMDLSCAAIAQLSRKNQIDLYPKTQEMPNLYLDQPYVILGCCDQLDDFVLFVQGRLKDRWLNIKKTVTFINAKQGGVALKKEWALQQAYQCYERYLVDENPSHLAQARELLSPYNLRPAFAQ